MFNLNIFQPIPIYQSIFKKFFCLSFCLFLALNLLAQVDSLAGLQDSIPEKRKTIFQYVQQDSILHLHIKTPLKILRKFEADPKKHSAKLTLSNTALEKTKWKIKLEQRGNLRRNICKYKPQRLKFSKKQLNKRGLIPRRNVKMVMRCYGKESNNQQVLKEYLAYRLYNLLTEKSYQVQLIHATFQDTSDIEDTYETYGFLLEPTKEIGIRVWASMSEEQGKATENLKEKEYLKMAIFQYMIGNTDWNIKLAHNIKFLREPAENSYIPIPYDFDFAGLVNAYYAEPNEALPIEKVNERLYIGPYENEGLLKETVQFFHNKKAEMKRLVLDFPYLNEKERAQTWGYLEEFFKKIESDKPLNKTFRKGIFYQDIMKLDKRKVN